MIKAILTDIEGTISSSSFVKDVLFPYAYKKLPDFIKIHENNPYVKEQLQKAAEISGTSLSEINKLCDILQDWILQDRKETLLKNLQGLIWEEGYRNADFKADLFDSAFENFKRWKQEGKKIFVFSSGSVKAQKLFFTYNEKGNILYFFEGFFDTTIGPKNDPQSYIKIAKAINFSPKDIEFWSDSESEIEAAQTAGMHIYHVK
jgi:enolase-phosphatase E1